MKSGNIKSEEDSFIQEHFSLILENREKILSHRLLKNAWSPHMYLSFAYIAGGGLVPIIFLFKAWERGMMTGHCPHCGNGQAAKSLHLFNMCGSILSGANSGWGVCARCFEPSNHKYVPDIDGLYFGERALAAIALKREMEIPDDFAIQWLGAEAVAEVRGGMIVDGQREFIGDSDLQSDPDNDRILVSIPPSLGKLVEILQS